MDKDIFVQNVQHFCTLKGVTPTVACMESGAGKDLMGYVKKGSLPSVTKVQLLATYLGVTTSELLGEPNPKAKSDPVPLSEAEAALNAGLVNRLCQLTPEELLRVDAFVQGMLGNR